MAIRKSPYFSGSTVHGVTSVFASSRSSAAGAASHSPSFCVAGAGMRSTMGVNWM
jgi:hypothetical protein